MLTRWKVFVLELLRWKFDVAPDVWTTNYAKRAIVDVMVVYFLGVALTAAELWTFEFDRVEQEGIEIREVVTELDIK